MNGHPYYIRYHPPMPVVEVALLAPGADTGRGPLRAIIDTGSDGTLVPTSLLEYIGSTSASQVFIHSHWGESREVEVHFVDIQIEGRRLEEVQVVSDDRGREIILGRNVLNQLILLLDGPAEESLVLSERP